MKRGIFQSASFRAFLARLRDDSGPQIAEFALSLPLLVVFVVGIFDFSSALTLKQKLTNAALVGARVAAADPFNDVGSASLPISVQDAFYVVDNYLVDANVNDCGLSTAMPNQNPGTLTWVSTTPTCIGASTNSLTLTINRGFMTQQTVGEDVIGTQVHIQYPYKWRFNSVISVLIPGASYASVSYITTSATAFNEN
ncbi:MAG TPA: TadE/TadG family type IV pilus assembly protein [Candidatus Binatia bacterium]|nr:TadE/TadG family type IV pilus assembly protein [Candidatus Binatia bacterium]